MGLEVGERERQPTLEDFRQVATNENMGTLSNFKSKGVSSKSKLEDAKENNFSESIIV